MIVVILVLVLLFFFFRVEATSYFYFFKNRFKDENETQLFETCEVLKETFVISDENMDYVNSISGEPYSMWYSEYDGNDIDLLYRNEFFFGVLEGYYEDLSRYEDLDEVLDLMGVSYQYFPEDLEPEEIDLKNQDEEGMISFGEDEDEDDMGVHEIIEEYFLPEHWSDWESLADVISKDEIYETYEDAKDHCFSDFFQQSIMEGDREWWLCNINDRGGVNLVSSIYDLKELKEFLEKWEIQRKFENIPSSRDYFFDSFFQILYLKKNLILETPRIRFLLRNRRWLLLVELGLFSWIVSFCTDFFSFNYAEQQMCLGALREVGGYDYSNFFGIYQNLNLFIHFFLSNIKNLDYISQVGGLCKVDKFFLRGERKELGLLFGYDFETFFQSFGIDFHWVYLFVLLRNMWLFIDLVELHIIVMDFIYLLRYYMTDDCFQMNIGENWVEIMEEMEEIRRMLGDLLIFLYFYIMREFLLCDEYWFYVFGSLFCLPDYWFMFFRFFLQNIYKDCV